MPAARRRSFLPPAWRRKSGNLLHLGTSTIVLGLAVLVATEDVVHRVRAAAKRRATETDGPLASEPRDTFGRDAEGPAQIPPRGWLQVLKRTHRESKSDNLGLVAAGVAFYGFLALTPLLASLVLLYGLVVEPAEIVAQVQALGGMVPADAAGLIQDQLETISATASDKSLIGLVLALGLAVFSAMKGAGAVITALNVVYEEEESRGLVRLTLTRAGLTVGALCLGIAILAAGSVTAWIETRTVASAGVLVRILSWLACAALASAFVAVVYRYGPDRRRAKWSWLTPGSVLAMAGIIVATAGFGLYATYVGKFNATYGSLGAVIAVLTWLYVSAYVLLMGGELNAELEHQTTRDSTAGPEKPMGARHAVMADTVAAGGRA